MFLLQHELRNAHRFVQSLVDLKLAVEEPIPVISTKNRTRACRITHKSIYRELGVSNIRHRRDAGPAVYLRRLLSLDYVIDHPNLYWLPTEDEKVWFCKHLNIGKDRLPQRIYGGVARRVTRYFPIKLPIAAGQDHHVCLCRSEEPNRHRTAALGRVPRKALERYAGS